MVASMAIMAIVVITEAMMSARADFGFCNERIVYSTSPGWGTRHPGVDYLPFGRSR